SGACGLLRGDAGGERTSPRGRSSAPGSVELQLTHLIPSVALDLPGDDARGPREVRADRLEALREVVALDVRCRALVGVALEEHVLVVVLQALGPVEEEVPLLRADGLGE